jgi:hypothetical protein
MIAPRNGRRIQSEPRMRARMKITERTIRVRSVRCAFIADSFAGPGIVSQQFAGAQKAGLSCLGYPERIWRSP